MPRHPPDLPQGCAGACACPSMALSPPSQQQQPPPRGASHLHDAACNAVNTLFSDGMMG